MILFLHFPPPCNLHQDDDNVTIYLREEEGHVSLVHLEPNYFSAFCSRKEDAEEVLYFYNYFYQDSNQISS